MRLAAKCRRPDPPGSIAVRQTLNSKPYKRQHNGAFGAIHPGFAEPALD